MQRAGPDVERGWNVSKVGSLVRLAAVGLVAAAVTRELRKAPNERTWEGRVAGFIPYDLRWPPTLERVRERWWNPGDPRLFTEHVFGVGWSVNLARATSFLGGSPGA